VLRLLRRRDGGEEHHLYPRSEGCPDDLTVWLCRGCHGRAHGMRRRLGIRAITRAALQAAKGRGVRLGNRTNLAEAGRHARSMLSLIRAVQASGARTLAAIAAVLNACGGATARGGSWAPDGQARPRP
jgi:hypothetical protein